MLQILALVCLCFYMKSLLYFFFFVQIHLLLLQYIKLAAHVFTVELSFTNITEVGKGVFICPLLETHSKNTALSYLHSAKTVPPPHTEDQLYCEFSSYTRVGFCLMYLVKINFVLFVQY